jgi:serine/threonine-protein kinase
LAEWSREQLAEIERQLTQIVGPVAKVLVRSAASNTANRQQLYAMLADHLHTPEERHRFLAGEAAAGMTNPGTVLCAAPAATPGVHGGRPLTPETLERASQLLARYLGPIASIVTKRAAQTATDEPHLYSLLAGKLSNPVEQERFMREAERQ